MPNRNEYSPLPPWQRTNYCGSLRAADAGREVAVFGWVAARRDHGSLIFIDLRDREGILQLVFNPAHDSHAHQVAERARNEYFLAARGTVVRRSEATVNAELPTGEVEVMVSEAKILATSAPVPFQLDEPMDEQLRLEYRFLDLRRADMQRNLRRRALALQGARAFLDGQGFVEIETPILWRATPEGARDYLVPSRVNPGRFYALPQSPQLLKQTLMIGGFDRYYQIARCFRDEDLRANRQPEFSQIDIEMTCPRVDDIIATGEGMMASIYRRTLGVDLAPPFARLTWNEAMERFGSDKPDLRFAMELCNLTEAFAGTAFKIFADALAREERIYGIRVAAENQLTRRDLDEMGEAMRSRHGLGVVWARIASDGWQGPIARHVDDAQRARAAEAAALVPGATLLMMAGPPVKIRPLMGDLRLQLGAKFGLRAKGEPGDVNGLKFLWVTDFPLFEYSDEEKRMVSVNHPFTAPHPEDAAMLESSSRDSQLAIRALAYDLVLNGEELGGGSIRIHNPEMQLKAFEVLGMEPEEAERKFGFFIRALRFGAPPHGGIAFGVERIAMLLCGTESIRDVMAFPKTQRAADLMSGAPSEVDQRQLRELSIKVAI